MTEAGHATDNRAALVLDFTTNRAYAQTGATWSSSVAASTQLPIYWNRLNPVDELVSAFISLHRAAVQLQEAWS
jgi:hypothetical protein